MGRGCGCTRRVRAHEGLPHKGQRVLLPHDADHIECQSEWQMGLTAHPEATYLLFPFDLPGAQPRFDVELDVRFHSSISEYTLLSSSQPVTTYSEYNTVGPIQFPGRIEQAASTTAIRCGSGNRASTMAMPIATASKA